MSVDWRVVARAAGYRVVGADVTVTLGSGRQQKVTVDDARTPEAIRFWSIILGPKATGELGDGQPLEYAWERNRLSDLIGFTLDSSGRLIGETWLPIKGITAAVLGLHISELARVCDWHELRLSGTDGY